MKLTNNRFYFDYNATSPLATTVMQWISKGDFPFANPSSIHSSGKKSKRLINETKDFLYETFGLAQNFNLFFHSGATEGINSIVKGFAKKYYKESEKINFFYASTDHSCVNNLREDLELYGHKVHKFEVDENGDFDLDQLVDQINSTEGAKLLNFTFVNNETGVVWPLSLANTIKERTGCFVHVDSVQAIGKIDNWKELSKDLDCYTFSGHKFGASKGIGFSFMKDSYPFLSTIRGGGQQDGIRSGTENVHGIYSLKLALEELIENFNYEQLLSSKLDIEEDIISILGTSGQIAGAKARYRNANTIYFTVKNQRADILMTAFDLAKMDVSSGSACSSGAIVASRVLLSMGFDENEAKSALRISFSPFLNPVQADEYKSKISIVLKRFV